MVNYKFQCYKCRSITETNIRDDKIDCEFCGTEKSLELISMIFTIQTDKPVYQAAEKLKVTGTAQRVQQGNTDGLVIPFRVEIFVESTDFPIKRFKSVKVLLKIGTPSFSEYTFQMEPTLTLFFYYFFQLATFTVICELPMIKMNDFISMGS